MLGISVLPVFDSDKKVVRDGVLFKASDRCLKSCRQKCIEYYSNIWSKNGKHICPYGYTSFVKDSIIYTSFRLKGYYKKQKEINAKFNPIIDELQLNEIVNYDVKNNENLFKLEEAKDFVKDIVHEIRNINAQIISKADNLAYQLQNQNNRKKKPEWGEISRNILSLGEVIETRFLCYDISVNPESLLIGGTKITSIYKKFDKMRMCFNDLAKEKNINIKFSHTCDVSIDAYNSFELVPYLIIDNLIKYTIPGNDAVISFNKFEKNLSIEVRSCGPYVKNDEIDKITKKGFRAEAAIKYNKKGSGIGLSLLKKICDIHSISVEIESTKVEGKVRDSVDIGIFKLVLMIKL